MEEFRCRACKRYLGIGPRALRIYCNALCEADLYPAAGDEGRDALIEALMRHSVTSYLRLVPVFGISRQRIEKICVSRDLKRTAAAAEELQVQ